MISNKATGGVGLYIGRPSIFGNPFEIGKDGTRSEVIGKYEIYFTGRLEIDEKFQLEFFKLVNMARTGDISLVCWCYPQRCHGEVIKKYIELELNKDQMKSIFKRKSQ